MKPLQRGKETGLVEIPANWCVFGAASRGGNVLTAFCPDVPITLCPAYYM